MKGTKVMKRRQILALPHSSASSSLLWRSQFVKQVSDCLILSQSPPTPNPPPQAKQYQNRLDFQVKEIDGFLAKLDEVKTIQELDKTVEDTTACWAQSNFFIDRKALRGVSENDAIMNPKGGGCKNAFSQSMFGCWESYNNTA